MNIVIKHRTSTLHRQEFTHQRPSAPLNSPRARLSTTSSVPKLHIEYIHLMREGAFEPLRLHKFSIQYNDGKLNHIQTLLHFPLLNSTCIPNKKYRSQENKQTNKQNSTNKIRYRTGQRLKTLRTKSKINEYPQSM